MEITLSWIRLLGRRAAPFAGMATVQIAQRTRSCPGDNMKRVGVCHLISLVGERRLQASDATQHSLFPCS